MSDPATFVRIVCRGDRRHPHAETTVYSRQVDLEGGRIADGKRTLDPDVDPVYAFDLLDTDTLHCTECGFNERGISIDDLTRLLARLAEGGQDVIPLRAVRSTLRAIR